MMFSINSLTDTSGVSSVASVAASAACSGFAHWDVDTVESSARPPTANRNMEIRIAPPSQAQRPGAILNERHRIAKKTIERNRRGT